MVTFFDDCPFNGKRKMADLIFADNEYLLTLERFNISLGFGNYTISEVLKNSNVDENTFLLVVNTLFDYSYTENYPLDTIDILQIVNYLKKTHNYFINYKLPSLRAMLRDVIEGSDDLHKNLLIEFFEKYENEVIRHMQFEESHVFHDIVELLNMPESRDHNIGFYEE